MRLVLTAVFVLALVFTPSSLAAAISEQLPLETSFTNPCTGETFAVTGTVHHVLSTTTSGSGQLHVTEHFNFAGVSGTTASGARYVVPNSNTAVTSTDLDGAPSSFRFEARQRFIRLGSNGAPTGDDLTIKVVSVFVVDADGNVTRQQFDVTVECH